MWYTKEYTYSPLCHTIIIAIEHISCPCFNKGQLFVYCNRVPQIMLKPASHFLPIFIRTHTSLGHSSGGTLSSCGSGSKCASLHSSYPPLNLCCMLYVGRPVGPPDWRDVRKRQNHLSLKFSMVFF